jgi:hypothetical protein
MTICDFIIINIQRLIYLFKIKKKNALPRPGSAWISIHFQSRIRIRNNLKKLDPDPNPHNVNADPKPTTLVEICFRVLCICGPENGILEAI